VDSPLTLNNAIGQGTELEGKTLEELFKVAGSNYRSSPTMAVDITTIRPVFLDPSYLQTGGGSFQPVN